MLRSKWIGWSLVAMKSKPPVPASPVSRRNALIGDDQKTGRGHEADRERAAARIAGRVECREFRQRERSLCDVDCCAESRSR